MDLQAELRQLSTTMDLHGTIDSGRLLVEDRR